MVSPPAKVRPQPAVVTWFLAAAVAVVAATAAEIAVAAAVAIAVAAIAAAATAAAVAVVTVAAVIVAAAVVVAVGSCTYPSLPSPPSTSVDPYAQWLPVALG